MKKDIYIQLRKKVNISKNIREQIDVGCVVKYKHKEYVVIGIDILCACHNMIVRLVRIEGYSCWQPIFKLVKELWDEKIETLEIISIPKKIVVLD